MLDNHLIAKTSPVANAQNVVKFDDYRITVLGDKLFRIEKSSEAKFTDEATQVVWFRDVAPIKFSVNELDCGVEITTGAVTLYVDNDYEKSYCLVGGKKVALNNEGNLLGTYRTLDRHAGSAHMWGWHESCPVETGVCSRTGVAVLDDKDSLILNSNGELSERDVPERDEYIFAFGNDYPAAVKALYAITGNVPLVPRFALGNWWSRYHVYDQDEYINILRRFEDRNVPLTVATIDMDWHYSNDIVEELNITDDLRKKEYGTDEWFGWTGYTWNKNLFYDYKKLLKDIKERNLKITLNLHPKDGVRFYEDQYEDMCKAMDKVPDKTPVEFDMTDDKFINNYFKILHKPYENDGVEFWWIDWQQGTESKKTGLDPLWCLNHYHYLDNAVNHEAPLILSRYCKAGSHRYPVGFSGDTTLSFATLNYLPYFTATASNIGYTWWSHDIGGHYCGTTDNEIYVRSIQFGTFSPILRLHCCNDEVLTKEPWIYQNGSGYIAEEYLRFRHSMIPYIYSEGYKVHKNGDTLIKPLYYKDPTLNEAYKYKNEYYFGDLLVCPITKHSGEKGMSELEIWLPEGRWTDIFTGETYFAGKGGKTMKIYRWLDTIPVFAKAGTILPLSADKGTNSVDNPKTLELNVFEGDGEYELYEDKDGKTLFTTIKTSLCGGKSVTAVSFKGDQSVAPENRTLKMKFRNCNVSGYAVTADGEEVDFDAYTDEYAVVTVKNVDLNKTYEFAVSEGNLDGYVIKRALESLKKFEFDNPSKNDLYNNLKGRYYESNAWHQKDDLFDGSVERLEELCGVYALPEVYKDKLVEAFIALEK